jgi:hypothetical protein
MVTLSAPAGCRYAHVPTSTQAKRPPRTEVEYDVPVLAIRKGHSEDLYDVAEFPTGWDGRAFQLVKDSDRSVYDVFVSRNGQDDRCDCTGHLQHGRCKHVDSLQALIEAGLLVHPCDEAPAEPWPTPEQLAEAAGVPLPF